MMMKESKYENCLKLSNLIDVKKYLLVEKEVEKTL